MSEVFVSYRRKGEDEQVAKFFQSGLEADGMTVFRDVDIPMGIRWAEEIKRQLEAADVFLILLSEHSADRDMVREETRLAYKLCREREDGRPLILPVRLRYEGELPYDMAAWLNPIQYALWCGPEDNQAVLGQVLKAIKRESLLPHAATKARTRVPLKAEQREETFEPRLETTAMPTDGPFYVDRGDDEAWRDLTSGTGTVTVHAPSQYGKSSFLKRMEARAAAERVRTAPVDFRLLACEPLCNQKEAYLSMAQLIAEELDIDSDPAPFFEKRGFATQRLLRFLLDGVLRAIDGDVLLFCDEVDEFFEEPFAHEFFGGLRYIIDEKARKPELMRIRMVFAYAANPDYWLPDRGSPFRNVAVAHDLGAFSIEDIRWLNRRHRGKQLSSDEEAGLLHLLGGHPALTRRALYLIASERTTFGQLLAEAADAGGPFGDFFRSRLLGLLNRPKLPEAFQQIIETGRCADELLFLSLSALGLVRGESHRRAAPSCDLFARYFRERLAHG